MLLVCAVCAGGGHVWALPGPMLASHGPLAFARGSGSVAIHRGRLGGFCSAEFELSSAGDSAAGSGCGTPLPPVYLPAPQ